MAAPLLRATGLRFCYPGQAEPALHDVGVSLSRGEALGLLGPNGSGKSTLLSLLIGVRTPQSGTIAGDGGAPPVIAWVPQECAFYPQLSCLENLRFFASLLALGRAGQAERVERAVAACQLQEFAGRPARQCSGGVRRRLNIAIALLQQPDVLLLDEPTVGIDPQSRAFLLEQVRRLAREGTAVVYATHYMEEVVSVCSRILLLDRGRVLADGDLRTLLRGRDGGEGFADLESLFMHYTHRSLRD